MKSLLGITVPSPPVLSDAGGTVTDPFAVAELFASHFDGVSKKDTT